jgi:hypothetical protein
MHLNWLVSWHSFHLNPIFFKHPFFFPYESHCNQKGKVHRTHNTSTVANEPCRLRSTDLLYSHRTPNLLTQQLLTGSFLPISQVGDVQTQQHDQLQASFSFLTAYTDIKPRNFLFHLQNMYNPENTSSWNIRRLTKQTSSVLFQFSFSFSLILVQ